MNIYKIQFHWKAEAQYIICTNISEAIEIWKNKMQTKKDPEVVEWVADHYYQK